MTTRKQLEIGKTHRMEDAGIFNGVYVSPVYDTDETATIMTEVRHQYGAGSSRIHLEPAGLRALAADLIAAADFIEECAAERAVNDLTNTDAQ